MKSLRWNLDALYPGFESQEFKDDFERFEKELVEFQAWTQENFKTTDQASETLQEYLRREIEHRKLIQRLSAYCHLTLSVDSKDEAAKRAQNGLRNHLGDMTQLEVRFIQFIKQLENLEDLIRSSEFLLEHEFYLLEKKQEADHLLSVEEEVVIANMQNTGSMAFGTLQGDLTANLMIEVDLPEGRQQLPLAAVRNLAYSTDAAVRKIGYDSEQMAYGRIEESSAAALNAIKGDVITVAKLRGWSDPMAQTLVDSRMTSATLDTLILTIEEYLPYFRQYLKRKAELLGYTDGLPFYELFAPIGEVARTFTYESAIDYIVTSFKPFSQKLADYVQGAYDKEWLDVEPRAGKRGGAFCSNLPTIGESRIMSNFNGSFSNMTTLAHELGHGYHGHQLKSQSILNTGYPMPIAETASIFNETIVTNAALSEAAGAEKIAILESNISDANQVITDIYSRFLFESELFERRKTSTLSVNELKEIMTDAQKKAYGNGLDHNILHPYMWMNKPHYYRAELSFYNFPYAFGLLFAKGLYARYLTMGDDFLPLYDQLLAATGKQTIKDLTASVGIDIESPDFFRSSLDLIKGDIMAFLELTDKGVNQQ